MTKEIIIKYHPDGSVTVEGVGFIGQECLAASKPFELALGLTDIDREMKPDEPTACTIKTRDRNQVSS